MKVKKFKCNDCTKTFTSKQNLKLHLHSIHNNAQSLNIVIHTANEGHKVYQCESCGESFAQVTPLKRHIQNNHEGLKVKIKRSRFVYSPDQIIKL